MTLDLTVTDLFCGAGGASLGLVAAGAVVSHAANHWDRACETYNDNHPDTRVLCADVSQTDPKRFPSTDVLWASPECTTFSQAGPRRRERNLFDDGDPVVERSRVTMWDVVRFAEQHRYKLVIVENVVDVGRWTLIDVWFEAMRQLGYRWRTLSINSFIAHPTPQSRDRWYSVFSLEGNPEPDLEIRPACWCAECGAVEGVQTWKRPGTRWGKYRRQYIYTCSRCRRQALPYVWPAASAIDWSIPCPRIGDRERPLAPATLARIRAGLDRYGPAVVQAAGHTYERPGYYRTWPMWGPLPTQAGTLQHGVGVPPFMLSQYDYRGGDEKRVYGIHEPVRTIVADGNHQALVVPVHHADGGPEARPACEPHRTQTGRAENAVVVPMRTHNGPRHPGEPLAPLTTSHGGGHGLLAFVDGGKGAQPIQPARGPGPAVTGAGSHFVVTLRRHGEGRSVEEPVGTVSADGNHHALTALPFLTSYYGNGRLDEAKPVSEPGPTVISRDHHALVEPLSIAVDDCGFRMLEPHEAGAAMAFPADYRVGGSKRDRVRQYGQAVTPPVAALILDRAVGSLT